MKFVQNYIDGEFVNSKSGDIIDDINPATGEKIATIPRSSSEDITVAVNACEKASNSWSSLSIFERANWLEKIANELEKRFEEIATLESTDTGKPISLARNVDSVRSVTNFRFFSDLAKKTVKKQHFKRCLGKYP